MGAGPVPGPKWDRKWSESSVVGAKEARDARLASNRSCGVTFALVVAPCLRIPQSQSNGESGKRATRGGGGQVALPCCKLHSPLHAAAVLYSGANAFQNAPL